MVGKISSQFPYRLVFLVSVMFIMSVLSSFIVAAEKVTYTPTTKEVCEGKTCSLEIYPGVQFVQEAGAWKDITKAKSLKNSGITLNIEYGNETGDPDYLEIEDWNYTSLTLANIFISEGYNDLSDLPVKEKDKAGNEKNLTKKKLLSEKLLISNWTFGEELHLGQNSTTLIINLSSHINYVLNNSPTSNNQVTGTGWTLAESISSIERVYYKVNLSTLPFNITILNANITLRTTGGQTIQNASNFSFSWVYYNVSWNKTGINWNNQPCGKIVSEINDTACDSNIIKSIVISTQNQIMAFNISSQIIYDYSMGNYSSYMLRLYNETSPNTTSITMNGPLNNPPAPIVYLTYQIDDLTSPQVNITFPQTFNYLNGSLDLNYTASDDIQLSKCWYSLDNGLTNSSPVNCGTNWTLSPLNSNGSNTWILFANDSSNNLNLSSVTFTVYLPLPPEPPATLSRQILNVGLGLFVIALFAFTALYIKEKLTTMDITTRDIIVIAAVLIIGIMAVNILAVSIGGVA